MIHLKYSVGGDTLQLPWTAREMNMGVLEKIKPETPLEAKMTKLSCLTLSTS